MAVVLENVRQYYFTEGEFLKYEKNYALLKNSPNYKNLNSNMAQQILKEVDGSFKSFFGLLKLADCRKLTVEECQKKYPNGNVIQKESGLYYRVVGKDKPEEGNVLDNDFSLEDVYLYLYQ